MSNAQFVLDIRFPDQPPKRFDVNGKVAMGSDPRCKIHIPDYDLAPVHCIFTVKDSVLTLQNTGGDRPTILDGKPLEHSKNYILDIGDKVEIGDIDLIVRVHEEEELPDSTLVRNLFSPSGEVDPETGKHGSIADLLKSIDSDEDNANSVEDSISFNVDMKTKVAQPSITEKDVTESSFNIEDEILNNEEENEPEVQKEATSPRVIKTARSKTSPERKIKEKTATKSLVIEHAKRDEAEEDDTVSQSSSFFDSITRIISKAKKDEKKKKKSDSLKENTAGNKKLKLKGKGSVDKSSLKKTSKAVPKITAKSAKGKAIPKDKRPQIDLDIVGTFPRLFSILAGLSLVHLLINELGFTVDAETITTIKTMIGNALALIPMNDLLPAQMANVVSKAILRESTIQFFILYFAIEFISTLIFGVTVPQAIFGISSTGKPVAKRIKGLIRVFIGMITFPFVIFDIPALIKKKTLKEVLSGNTLQFSFKPLKFIGIIPITLIILLPLEIPFIQHDGINAKKYPEKTISMTGDIAKVYTLPFLGLQVLAELDEYEIFPRIGRSKQTPIGLDFYKKNSLLRAGIRKEKEINALEIINTFEQGNFFFSLCNPTLNDSLENETAIQGSDKELEEILLRSFNITPETLPAVLISQGPELKKLYEFKENFKSAVGIKENAQLEIIKTKNFNIFSFFHPDDSLYSLVIIHNLKFIVFEGDYSRSQEQLTELVAKVFPEAEFPQKLKLSDTKLLAFELANILHHYKFNGALPTASDLQKFVTFYKEKLSELSLSEDAQRKEKIIKGHLGEMLNLLQGLPNTGNWQAFPEFTDLASMKN